MSVSLRQAVERMQKFLNDHPELAECDVYANDGEDGEFNARWNDVVVELPDGDTETVIDFLE